MSARKVHDLAVVVGQYQKDGQTKNRYQNIGVMMETDTGGRFILLDRSFNPAGVPYDAARGNQIMVSLFDDKPAGASSGAGQQRGPAADPAAADDDIPF
jgi:hypothetical protein